MHSTEKRLNEMNRLGDMLHFPAVVNAGATLNVLATIAVTWWLAPRHPDYGAEWIALVLAVNLLPVMLLRMLTMGPETVYPKLGEMDFFRDQHKFSDWVYLAASANMAFWVLLAWKLGYQQHFMLRFLQLEVTAGVVTYSPVLLRGWLGRK